MQNLKKPPKRPNNPYFLFREEVYSTVKAKYQIYNPKEVMLKIALMWKNLPAKKKDPYYAAYQKNKTAY